MEQKPYEAPVIVDLGSVQELTLANFIGTRADQTIPTGEDTFGRTSL